MFERFEQLLAATQRRPAPIRRYRHQHDGLSRFETADAVPHQHGGDSVLVRQGQTNRRDPTLAHSRIVLHLNRLQGGAS